MTTIKRRSLQIDDPLGPSHPAQPTEPPGEGATITSPNAIANRQARAARGPLTAGRRGKPETSSRPATVEGQEPPAADVAGQADDGVWRTWSGITGVGSFRLPHELLIELGDTAREGGLPIGMIVTAAITQLLDQPPDTIARLVDRADDARIEGRRNGRRRRIESAGD